MRKATLLLCLLMLTEAVATNDPSLVWMGRQDVSQGLAATIYRNLGDSSIAELPGSALIDLENNGVKYEIIDSSSTGEEYWVVWDFSSQGFDQIQDLVEVLKIYGNGAVIKGDRKTIEEEVPGFGFELERLFRRPPKSPKKPLLGKGGLRDVLEEVSADSIESHIRLLESFGTRYSYAYECTLAAYALYNKFQQYGLPVEFFSFPFSGPGAEGLNVVATLQGEDAADIVYIICGHYDSISNDPYNSAPGADDNASGTAAVIEAARLLKGYSPEATVKFICFGGEEQGLYGSWHYAGYADSVGMDIRGVLNFDMIAYCDVEGYFDLNVITDNNSEPLADMIIAEGEELPALALQKVIGGGGSDHVPFWVLGYPALLMIEKATDHWNPYYHSTDDTTGTLTIPFATEVVKLGVAGLLRLARFFPEVSVYDDEWIDSGGDGHADPADTVSLTVSLFNSGRGASTVEAVLSSADPFITIIDSSSDFGELPSDSIRDNGADPFVLWVDGNAPVHVCTLNIAITVDSFVFYDTTSIMIGIPPILLIDGDGGDSYETYFTSSLNRMGVLCDLLDPNGGVTSSYLRDYQALVGLTGDNSFPLDSSGILIISEYLDSGGNLFVTGQDVEKIVGESFCRDYLHAALVQDSTHAIRVDGTVGDPIGDGLSFLIMGAPGANNQVTPSIISPIDGADSILSYRSGGCCGVTYEGTYKTVYLSFGFEAMNPALTADSLMIRILRWFGLPVGVDEALADQSPSGVSHYLRTQPNPFKEELQIEYFVRNARVLELRIYDASGRMVREVARDGRLPGVHRVRWDGRDSDGKKLPSGIYFCRMQAGDLVSTNKMILLR